MKIQVKKSLDQERKTQTKNQKQNNNQLSEEQIKRFLRQLSFTIREYELKKLSLNDMYKIYARNAMSPYFENTLKSALVLIFMPALTNLYYTFRPNSPLSSVFPWAMPFICLGQYFYVINKDFERFCFNNSEDAKELRQKYKILYAYSLQDKIIDNIVEDIIELEEKQKKNDKIV